MAKIDPKKVRPGYAPTAGTRPGVDDRTNKKKASPTKKNIQRESKKQTAVDQSPKRKSGKFKKAAPKKSQTQKSK